MKLHLPNYNFSKTAVVAVAVFLCVCTVAGSAYAWYVSDRMLPRVWIGSLPVGGMTRDDAAATVQRALDGFTANGIQLDIEGTQEVVNPGAFAFDVNLGEAVDTAFRIGHEGSWFTKFWQRITAPLARRTVEVPVRMDVNALRAQLLDVADATNVGRRDIRLQVAGTNVKLLTDTQPGKTIDQTEAFDKVTASLRSLVNIPIPLRLHDDMPRANPATAPAAVQDAKKLIARSLLLQYEDLQFYISRDKIGSWIISEYDGDQLKAGLDRETISEYVTTVAKTLNVAPQPPQITTEGGRVVGFVPMKVGRSVEENVLVQSIIDTIMARAGTDRKGDTIVVPLKSTKMALTGLDDAAGITELVGKATTPFTGSPRNRISNIKNGVKFLSGTVVQPGEEFSTLGTLGVIDNTTGYLPELVIKGDRTIPEFGGGLCQVSTTLFRAVLNAGLPVTARRNHSYRVSYYEKDGNGVIIGPGLDATIYEPDVDFRFKNDMQQPVLIIGYVIGDKITFELYGTKDGRTSEIIGPKKLSETSPGDPIYIETTDLAPGVIKQVETPHPGGSAIATYNVMYPDGTKKTTEFRSWYRRWPAQYLKGVSALSSPTLTPTQTP